MNKPWLTFVPAVAVIRRGLVLLSIIGRKGYVGGLILISIKARIHF